VIASREAREVIDPLARAQRALESDYDSMRKTFKPDWPPLVELRDKVERGRQEMQEAIQREARRAVQGMYSEYQSALREERRLGQELEAFKDEVLDQSSAASQLGNIRLEIESRRELLNEMLRRQSEADVAARQQRNRETNVAIVDHALVPGSPAYPSLRRDLTFALGAGLLLGLVVVVLLELLDRTLKNAEEAEKLLGLPVLAVIPDLAEGAGGSRYPEAYGYGGGPQRRPEGGSARAGGGRRGKSVERKSAGTVPIELVPHSKPRLAVSEGYRGLRTALLLSTADELRVVAVTSAGAGEGKTVTATNLAVVLAQLGRRVLLLDCDLRKPRLHRLFQLSNREGVVTYLTGGRDAELAVYPTEVPGLAVTPSGPAPPNPSELLSSDRMAELLAGLRTKFDFVILDTPPVLPVTDAVIVSAMTDGAVLCARAGKVLRDDAVACRDRLRRADVRVLGTVLNGFRSAHSGAGKRYHYYETYAYAEEAESGAA
jgi:capsular exopolysaccharide synthesis family protein